MRSSRPPLLLVLALSAESATVRGYEEEPGGLDKRKAYILATVVYEYIATAEPVGSQTLTQKYQLG